MKRNIPLALFLSTTLALAARAQQSPAAPWHFVVSGDSRNCGDVVMPGIAETAKQNLAAFYWHMGDLRLITSVDEDIQHQPEHIKNPLSISDYREIAWQDFIGSQIAPFGAIPFIVGIGNHETTAPMTRQQFVHQFARWIDSPMLRDQRLRDAPGDQSLRTYYHWVDRGISFYSLDNATSEQFDAAQVAWFERVLAKDLADSVIETIIVGMHEALPDSIASDHSMSDFPLATQSGRRVYADLLRARKEGHKRVYVLASHSHFFMDGVFNTDYWKQNGGALPGWIVGTAGAVRYKLPKDVSGARAAMTNVYGSLLGTVLPSGEIKFDYRKLAEDDIPPSVVAKYGKDFVHWCFVENSQAK
jgi:hypothetical protein